MSKVIFVPHGGGPRPVMNDPAHAGLTASLQSMGDQLKGAKAILVISAHWEESAITVSAQTQPGMYYDYYNFPPQAYELQYPAPGAPDLALQVQAMLSQQGIDCRLDHERGYDHGTFIPLMLMAPAADIPVLQMSLRADLDPQAHIDLGKALAPLLDQGVVIMGSGLTFHSFPAMRNPDKTEALPRSKVFDDWLNMTVLSNDEASMAAWGNAPEGRFCHPREEHLLPLHVCFGAGQQAGFKASNFYQETLFGLINSGFIWQ